VYPSEPQWQPNEPQWQQPLPQRRNRTWWIVGSVAVIILAVVVIVVVVETRSKADITKLKDAMFVTQSSFTADIDRAQWSPASVQTKGWSPPAADPPDCSPLAWGPRASQVGTASYFRYNGPGLSVTLYLAEERPDFVKLLSRCEAIRTESNGQMVYKPRQIAGLPDGIPSYQVDQDSFQSLGVKDMYRGICIAVTFSHHAGDDFTAADERALAKVFNDQMALLQAA